VKYGSLETVEEAKALMDCVYAVYGLTFHREHVYEPEQLLDLNRQNIIRSFIARDEDGLVQGHLGWLRPFFDVVRDGPPPSDERIGEIGLSIVRANRRGQHIQTHLGVSMLRWAVANGRLGTFMKCVTLHTHSQRASYGQGGRPLATFLGGIPKWVVYDAAQGERRDPLSTVLFFIKLGQLPQNPVLLPEDQPWLKRVVHQVDPNREVLWDPGGREPERGPTELVYQFQPAKHLAQVHVLKPGEDLLEQIGRLGRWLIRGHMKHVTFYMPSDSPRVQLAAPEFPRLGLFPAGWVPCMQPGGRDVLIYQALAYEDLDPDALKLYGDETEGLVADVVRQWRRTQRKVQRSQSILG